MAFVPVPNTMMVEIRSEYLGQRVENTLYFRKSGVLGPGDLATLAGEVEDWWVTGPRASLGEAMFLREIYVTDLTTATSPTYTLTISGDPGGPVTGDPTPGSVALCVSFRTGGRGRSSRGRNYICGFTESQTAGNTIAQTWVDAIVDAYNVLTAELGPGGEYTWVVVSRFTNGAPRVTGIAQNVSSAIAVDNIIDSQRRRLPGRGL